MTFLQKTNREAAGGLYTIGEMMLPALGWPRGNLAILQDTTLVPSFLGLVGSHPNSAAAPPGLHFLMSKGGGPNWICPRRVWRNIGGLFQTVFSSGIYIWLGGEGGNIFPVFDHPTTLPLHPHRILEERLAKVAWCVTILQCQGFAKFTNMFPSCRTKRALSAGESLGQ